MKPQNRIMVALDVPTLEEARSLISVLGPEGAFFKVGLELLTAAGAPAVVQLVKKSGGGVFFDGKFNDIPNTIASATKAVAALGVDFFDLHACSGEEAMRAAVLHRGSAKVLAVTVLTSFNDESCRAVFSGSVSDKVVAFARSAARSGVDGIVCSGEELDLLQQDPELKRLIKVIPGIRPAWAAVGDQKRVLTPRKAVEKGADYLVIGRPITQPPKEIGSPLEAFRRVRAELEGT